MTLPADGGAATPALAAAIVVNWNGLALTRACVASLQQSTGVKPWILVIDNASREDERVALVAEYGGAPGVELVLLDENRHFAGGVNAGARRALEGGATHLLFLNNDTTLAPDCLRLLLDASDADPAAGVIGPALLDLQPPHRALSLGERYSAGTLAVPRTLLKVRSTGDGTPYHVGGIMGSAILVTRDCFLRVGPYREDLLVYYEEVEFCLRARALGYSPLLVPRAVVLHDGMRGFASGLTPYAARLKCRNQLLLMRWHGGALAWLAFVPVFAALVLLSTILYALRGRRDVVAGMWHGVGDGLRQALGRAESAAAGGAA